MPRRGSLGWAVWSILVLGLGLPIAPSPTPTISTDFLNPCSQGQQCPGFWPFVKTHQAGTREEKASLRWLSVVRDPEGHSLELSQPTKSPFPPPSSSQPASGIQIRRRDVSGSPRKAILGQMKLGLVSGLGLCERPASPSFFCSSFCLTGFEILKFCLISVMLFLQRTKRH